MILSMVLQAFYNIVNSYFVSNMADSQGIVGVRNYAMNTLTLAFSMIIMLIGAVILQLFARQLISIFAVSEEIRAFCTLAIRIITLGYLFAGVNIAYQGIFQAFGFGMKP